MRDGNDREATGGSLPSPLKRVIYLRGNAKVSAVDGV